MSIKHSFKLSTEWFICAIFFLLVITMSLRMQNERDLQSNQFSFVPEAHYIERFCGTFKPVVALAYHMKGALELAHNKNNKTKMLFELFSAAVYLDPRLINSAFLGGMVTPTYLDELPEAINLLKFASSLNPEEWRLYYWTGFNYIELEQYEKGANYYHKASMFPDTPQFLKFSPIHLLARGDDIDIAILHTEQLQSSVVDQDTKDLLETRLAWMETMKFLEHQNHQYKSLYGNFPENLNDLVSSGLITEIPDDLFGEGFYLPSPGNLEKGYQVRSKQSF